MSDDLISRRAAKLKVAKVIWEDGDSCYDFQDKCVDCLDDMPSAQQEQKKGKWIKATGMMPPEFHGHHCCSECGNFANMEPPFGSREDLSKFCPNCGADMRGEQDGREG